MAKPSRHAFTLIELLIVIAIIGILMALLFPVVGGAINAARKASAKNDVVQIASAVIAYQTEYGQWPTNSSETATNVDGMFLDALVAGTNAANNPRKVVFLEVQAYKKGRSGTNSGGSFVDPWKQEYQIMVDTNYDNNLSGVPGAATDPLRKTVAVWSVGLPSKGSEKDGGGYQSNTNSSNFIKSWE